MHVRSWEGHTVFHLFRVSVWWCHVPALLRGTYLSRLEGPICGLICKVLGTDLQGCGLVQLAGPLASPSALTLTTADPSRLAANLALR